MQQKLGHKDLKNGERERPWIQQLKSNRRREEGKLDYAGKMEDMKVLRERSGGDLASFINGEKDGDWEWEENVREIDGECVFYLRS